MKRPAAALVTLILVALFAASVAIGGATASDATSLPQHSHAPFHVYLPGWLPSRFRHVHDSEIARYPETAAKFFMRRYGVQGRWVSIFEGPAGCCLDSVPSHRVGPTKLSHRRTAYASDQGPRFGGLYLFWDQDHTYIAFNSPNLSKQMLIRIAQSVTPTSVVHRLIATKPAVVFGTHSVVGISDTGSDAACWAPPESDPTVTVSCFTPSQVAQLHRRMPLLIDPSVVVRRLTHLSLTDTILLTRHGHSLLASLLYGDLKFSRPPFPSPARYLAVDEFPDGRYRAYEHRLAVLRLPDRLVQVKGYIPARDLSFRISTTSPTGTRRQIARTIIR